MQFGHIRKVISDSTFIMKGPMMIIDCWWNDDGFSGFVAFFINNIVLLRNNVHRALDLIKKFKIVADWFPWWQVAKSI